LLQRTKVVVTTQGGVVTTPNTHFFHVFWGYNLTTPLVRPFSGLTDPIQMPTPHRPLPRPLRFLRCASPCPGTLPASFAYARCARRHRITSPATADSFHRRCTHAQAWCHRYSLQAERVPEQPAPRATKMTNTTERREFAGKFAPAPACLRDCHALALAR
jgi:hypothetical protein